nr:hypothetical protein [Rhodovulum sp. BSW8]
MAFAVVESRQRGGAELRARCVPDIDRCPPRVLVRAEGRDLPFGHAVLCKTGRARFSKPVNISRGNIGSCLGGARFEPVPEARCGMSGSGLRRQKERLGFGNAGQFGGERGQNGEVSLDAGFTPAIRNAAGVSVLPSELRKVLPCSARGHRQKQREATCRLRRSSDHAA